MKAADLFDHAAEVAALQVLLDTAALDGVQAASALPDRERLTASDFHHPAHGEVYAAVVELLRRGVVPDLVGLADALKASRAFLATGGLPWLTKVASGAASAVPGAFPAYARTLRTLALCRQLVSAGRDIAQKATMPGIDPEQVLTEATRALTAIGTRSAKTRTVRDHLTDVLGQLDEVRQGGTGRVVKSGIEALDQVIGGLQPTLTVIGALPGVGKSALLAAIARNLARRSVRVGVFSLEDAGDWMPWRYLAHEANMSQRYLEDRRLNPHQEQTVAEAAERIWNYGEFIEIDDRSALSPQDIVLTARDMILNRGAKVIMVDHLGEVRAARGRSERFDLDVAEALSDLRSIAKLHGVPVVVAAHLNRKADEKPDEAPKLSQFANSSAVERQARVALGLRRDPKTGRIDVYVLKQTKGQMGVRLSLAFHGEGALVRNDGGEITEVA